MKGTVATMVLAFAATAGAEHFSGSRWVRTQQSAFVAASGAGASTVSRRTNAGLQQQQSSSTAQRPQSRGFFAPTSSRDGMTRVCVATSTETDLDLTVNHSKDEFCCQNAYFFANMCDVVYSERSDVQSILQGNETMTGLGFDHFKWFEPPKSVTERSLLDSMHDTEAFVAANDDVVMAVFRGTSELSDWVTNLECIPKRVPETWGLKGEGCDVHEGFDGGLNTVWNGENGMYETLKKLVNEDGKDRKLFISGHSLGGALATIAAARLAFEDDMKIAGVYTIGSPRVFDGQLSEHFDAKMNHGTPMKEKYFRCRNNNDIVPRIVPPPYEHVGTEVYLNRNGVIKPTTVWDHLKGRYDAYMKMEFGEDVNDHSASEYIRIFKQLAIDQGPSA